MVSEIFIWLLSSVVWFHTLIIFFNGGGPLAALNVILTFFILLVGVFTLSFHERYFEVLAIFTVIVITFLIQIYGNNDIRHWEDFIS